MRRLLLALPFALLPLATAHAEKDHDHAHGSLDAHEHGVAHLNVVLDDKTLELELESPAMNLVGFEHAASSPADKAKVADVRKQLEQPLTLFGLASAAQCTETDEALESPLFDDATSDDHHAAHEHSEIHAHYQLTCEQPGKLAELDLGPLFKAFPATQKITVQLIGPNGQKGLEATPNKATVAF
ncbi:hypothetical protein GCM10009504_15060 [Pseudomonas laurentiana]|uniref:DUF2796 domain-containing protein n=1 Tax=Pseudomonas laurentiana TaxID=2364649 RepID=A0A6I5RRR9_9PSED|nr:DUF2796 domain-containing protein [Pseudomonas laurentiana]NES10737.1 DUF2796 domain-containing protein [Pseudomonas laurentiana]GGU58995.1 hypothetical protein GCM10009504_15060 [Pseudomonas laurentiana]